MKVFAGNEIQPLNILLNRYGEVHCSPRWSSKTGVPVSSGTRVYFMEEGSGYLKTESQYVQLEPGYAYLIPANLYHEYGCTGLKKFYFQFRIQSKGLRDILSAVDRICQIRYDPDDLRSILEYYEKEDPISALLLRQLLVKNVIRLLQENNIPAPSFSPYSDLVSRAITYIKAETRSNLTVQAVCDHLFTSESRLQAAFRSETGSSVGQYIDKLVLTKAQRLLANPSLSIGQISTRLGFCDQFYFSRQFKKRFGMTPSAYRKSVLSENNNAANAKGISI